jgi:gelsolin
MKDSNIEAYGGQDHKDAKAAKAQAEAEYKGVLPPKIGIMKWRIENFAVKLQPTDNAFYSGDSYIVLNTYKKTGENTFRYNAHFWLGEHSTQDEKGTAAFKVVELDDLLGDMPVQYREVQGHESKKFLDCFGGNIRIMEGGVDSGFRNVKPTEYVPRLMHFKGKKRIRCTEVKCELASLNNGDVFLLDNGLELIQWNGTMSSVREKNKARDMIIALKSERGSARSVVLDGMEDHPTFWDLLGGKGEVAADSNEPDEKVRETPAKLFHVSDEGGQMTVTQICEGKAELKKSLLISDDVFVLDIGVQIFVWVGSGANRAERREAMKMATVYLTNSGRPMHTPITRVMEGAENTAFSACFPSGAFLS